MRKLILMMAFTLTGLVTATAQGKVETVEIKTVVYCDHCKQCESCGGRLETAVYDLKGIKRVDVDDKTMIVKVVYNPKKISSDAIRTAIAKSGYDADDRKAEPEAVAKLDDCCRKQ